MHTMGIPVALGHLSGGRAYGWAGELAGGRSGCGYTPAQYSSPVPVPAGSCRVRTLSIPDGLECRP